MIPDGEMRAERDDAPQARPDRTITLLLVVAAAIVVAVVAMWLWSTPAEPQPPAVAVPRTDAPPASSQAAASAPVQHPVVADPEPLQAQEIPAALGGLLGTKAAATFLQPDDFPRRFAATLDSLGREHASARIWPVLPTPGRFLVEERAEGTVIAPENAARYTPLV